jgi:hypothetical protein
VETKVENDVLYSNSEEDSAIGREMRRTEKRLTGMDRHQL